jgi:DNA end-binding protein Ku
MPRPLWKGSISFGLVNIPVTLHGAVNPETLRFRQIDRRSNTPVKEKRVSERTGQEVPWDDVVKGYEYEDGRYVLLEDAELRQANVKATQTIDIVQFARREEIDPLYFETPYYVVPGKGGAKGYALLRAALRESDRVGIAKVVVRFRQHMAALMPEGRLLVLELLRYGHEIRDAADLEVPGDDLAEVGVSSREVAMAETLVASMEEPWEPMEHHDEYRDAVLQLIDEKVRGGGELTEALPEMEVEEEGAEVIDIMALLKRSVEAAGGNEASARGSEAPAGGGARRSSRRRSTAEEPPVQAAAARRKRV